MRFVLWLYFLYGATTVFIPKIALPIEMAGVYPLEVVCSLLTVAMIFSGKLAFSRSARTYLLYSLLCLLSWTHGAFHASEPSIRGLLLVLKFSSFGFLIAVAQGNADFFNTRRVVSLFWSQVLFVTIAGSWVLYNTVFHPVPLDVLSGGYSPDYRLIGFTGQVLEESGLKRIGNTSVQMGVGVSILAVVSFSLFLHQRKKRYLLASAITVIGTLLTYSRSGLLSLLVGMAFLAATRSRAQRRFVVLAIVAAPILAGVLAFTDLGESVGNFGTIGKLFHHSGVRDVRRLDYWSRGVSFLFDNPDAILTGMGRARMLDVIGVDTVESLFFDTLLESGALTLLALLIFFIALFRGLGRRRGGSNPPELEAILRGVHSAIPGLFLACVMGGNSLQTDFIAPWLFLMFGSLLALDETEPRTTLLPARPVATLPASNR